MASGLNNQPKLRRGALVDIDPNIAPPLIVQFQFNPETLQRSRSVTIRDPGPREGREAEAPAGQQLGEAQATPSDPETISLDIRFDATDRLEQGDLVTRQFGVLPELAALEMMAAPRAPLPLAASLGLSGHVGLGGQQQTPVLVFVWGRFRTMAVRLTQLSIQETEFSAQLDPTRVIASVTLRVEEGANVYTKFSAAQRLLALRNAPSSALGVIRSLLNLG